MAQKPNTRPRKTGSRAKKAAHSDSRNPPLLKFLDELMAESERDSLPFWEEFERDLREHRFKLRLLTNG